MHLSGAKFKDLTLRYASSFDLSDLAIVQAERVFLVVSVNLLTLPFPLEGSPCILEHFKLSVLCIFVAMRALLNARVLVRSYDPLKRHW